MAITSRADVVPGAQPPSYEEQRSAETAVGLSEEAKRLFWTLDGPLHTSVFVMRDKYYDPGASLEPFLNPETEADPDSPPAWHQSSLLPYTEPKISSITVRVYELESWESEWLMCHEHALPYDSDEECPGLYQFGPLSDAGLDDDDGFVPEGAEGTEPIFLLECCGTKRPRHKAASLLIKAENGDFVTLRDYVSAVHPWLIGLRQDILGAMGVADDKPLPLETQLMVSQHGLANLMVQEAEAWKRWNKRPSKEWLAAMARQRTGIPSDNILGDTAVSSIWRNISFRGNGIRRRSQSRPRL